MNGIMCTNVTRIYVLHKVRQYIYLKNVHTHKHMSDNHIYQYSSKQFSFIIGRSTVLPLLYVLDDWSKILDQRGYVMSSTFIRTILSNLYLHYPGTVKFADVIGCGSILTHNHSGVPLTATGSCYIDQLYKLHCTCIADHFTILGRGRTPIIKFY